MQDPCEVVCIEVVLLRQFCYADCSICLAFGALSCDSIAGVMHRPITENAFWPFLGLSILFPQMRAVVASSVRSGEDYGV
ncbi:MAG: hypothetical protein CMJ70_01340 [Planctomycetaceae bacterium]|nr:hypothetical protein [Planctomycetaceae bacterium]